MTIRTTRKQVTFAKSFALGGVDGVQPAGTYEVETDDESIDDLSFLAYRRVTTLIHLQRDGATQVFRIDPVELDASLLRDAGLTVVPAAEGP
jgi:hypothetical protein